MSTLVMTDAQAEGLARQLRGVSDQLARVEGRLNEVERQLDRWEGAIGLVRWLAGLLGLSGIGLLIMTAITASKVGA